MLLNLSNHPSVKWTDQQKKIAIANYKTIKDLPFPQINPADSTDDVLLLAENYYIKIRKIAAKETLTVHLMGEMTFTYMLVHKLKQVGISCVASTTNRLVIEKDNKKIVQFQFIQFRSY